MASDGPSQAVLGSPAYRLHTERHLAHAAETARLEKISLYFSGLNLVLFGAATVVGGAGLYNGDPTGSWVGLGLFVAFLASYTLHGRVVRRRERSATREALHLAHLARMEGRLEGLDGGDEFATPEHPYAGDLDLFGRGSLFARLSVAHTEAGRRALASWLLTPASPEAIRARQEAVRELAGKVELRVELEAAILDTGAAGLDAGPFVRFVQGKKALLATPWLRAATLGLPLVTIALIVFSGSVLPSYAWVPAIVLHFLLTSYGERFAGEEIAMVASRARFVESYRALFATIEGERWESEALRQLGERLGEGGSRATVELRRLERWASLLELRQQGLVHLVVNPLLFWDLNVLHQIEVWANRVGARSADWFEAAGELEALSSLATFAHQDPDAIAPTIAAPGSPLEAEGLAHPLLDPGLRVPNDVRLEGERYALLITGSNMAGKSTLLRATGASVVCALAGGFVAAKRFSTPALRVRASMRVADSLQRGASYFQAELARLRTVVQGADDASAPPILFLLDELLRGTNARARHIGARAVVMHLLERRAMGLIATHDIALARLEEELAGDPEAPKVHNVHFTDVLVDGEMSFDYRLREGVVRTSNALRLLRLAGIDVEGDDSL